jgi:hypothetical protein
MKESGLFWGALHVSMLERTLVRFIHERLQSKIRHCLEAGRPSMAVDPADPHFPRVWKTARASNPIKTRAWRKACWESRHVLRLLFPPDFNSAAAVMEQLYRPHGQIWTLVVPKGTSFPIF